MRLLFDIGNTCCKFALWDRGKIQQHFSCRAEHADDMDLSRLAASEPDSIWVSSVRSKCFNDAFATRMEERFSISPRFARTMKSACEVTTAYRSALGIDRFLELIAVWREFHSACVIVDCGTAVTLDVLDASGVHLGGLIMPGLSMLPACLKQGTDQLPMAGAGRADALFATDTDDAITSGCRRMWSSGITSTVEQMKEMADASVVVVTGGDSGELCWRHTEWQPEYREIPVLEGLAVFAQAAEAVDGSA